MASGIAAGMPGRVEEYYRDYGCRARQLKKEGKQVIGYLCAFVPTEIITAAGLVPVRLKGDVHEPVTKADTYMETIACPFVRTVYDSALKGRFEFLDGLVIPHSCDSVCLTQHIWKYTLNLPYFHFLNVPHLTDAPSMEFFRTELSRFRQSLEKFTGKTIADEALGDAIVQHNRYRDAIRALYDLRKSDPPLISGSEMLKALVAGMGLPATEGAQMVSGVISALKQRQPAPATGKPRILIAGAQVDDTSLFDIVESTGASVVVDDLCTGTKAHWHDVDAGGDPIAALAERYLDRVICPRTFREKRGTHEQYLEDRFGHIARFIKDFNVNGVILYIYKYCDPYGFDVPPMKNYIESLGIPVLYLEDEYSMSSTGRLKTRVQAFLEMLG